MYIPQIEGQQDTKENVAFGMSIARQGKWDQLAGNTYLGSRLDTTVGALSLNNQMATTGLLKKDSVPLSQEDWKNSEWYREKLPYSPGMTSYRASVISQNYDNVQYQRYMNSQSKGVGRGILKFAGRLTGQLVDPINYIPFLGTGAKVLKMTPAAFTKQLALHPFTQPFLTSKALRGATEGFIASTLVQPFLNESARQIGESRTVGQSLADVMFGTAFSGVLSSVIPSNYDYFKSEYGKIIKQTSNLYSKKFDTFEKLKSISDIKNIESQLSFFKNQRIQDSLTGYSHNKIVDLSIEKNNILKKLGISESDINKNLKSLISENKIIDDSIETLTKDLTSFPQSTQINATKSLSAAVDSIIDGRMADVGEGGLSAMSDMMKKYGIKESPVSKRLAKFEKYVELKPVEKNQLGIPKEPVSIIDEPVISKKETSILDQNDMVELQKIDSDIAISQKIDEIMTQANNCLVGRV
jgi:hypothetical protein